MSPDQSHFHVPLPVTKVRQTCYACPSQWTGYLYDGREIYVRYRWGHLSVTLLDEVGGSVCEGEVVFSKRLGDGFDGVLSYAELINATAGVLAWPGTCDGRMEEDLE